MRAFAVVLLPSLLLGLGACRRTHSPPSWKPSLPDRPTAVTPPPTEASATPLPPSVSPASAPVLAIPGAMPAPTPIAAPEPRDAGAPDAARQISDAGTANGDPHGPKAEALNAVVKGAGPAFQRCFDAEDDLPENTDLAVSIHYRIEPKGSAADVSVNGKVPATVSKCLRAAMEALRFPEFQGAALNGELPVTYRRAANAETP